MQTLANVRTGILNYSKKNALIDKWKSNLRLVLNSEGPSLFAKEILAKRVAWDRLAEEWAIEADSEFGNQVLCLSVSQAVSSRSIDHYTTVLSLALPSKHWRPSSFKSAVEQTILASSSACSQQSDLLRDFVLNDVRLLDPRLPTNVPNWLGIGETARDLVIQWLSAEDIQLFFDHVLPKRDDPHGRKPFWLKYKGRVRRSRPLLAFLDESRWLANAATRTKRNFGKMDDSCDTSAFLLDFGRVIVVEFSKVGNAVYVYDRREVPDLDNSFWSEARFVLSKLKQKRCCIDAVSHTGGWELKMRTLLAQYGIHPGS